MLLLPVSAVAATPLDATETAWRLHLQGREVDLSPDGPLLPRLDASARAAWLFGTLAPPAAAAAEGGFAAAAALEDSDAAAAADAYAALLERCPDGGDDCELVALERLASLSLDAGRPDAAISSLKRCLELAATLGRPLAHASAELELGRALLRTRELDAAARRLAAADSACSALGLDRWRGDADLALSSVHRLRMDLDSTLAWREKAYAAYTAAGDLKGRARSLHFVGTTRAMMGDLTRSLLQLQEAEALARQAGDEDELSGCLGDQAGVQYLIGDFDLARSRYEEAISLARNPRRVGWYESNLGSILRSEGRYDEALAHHEHALEIARKTDDVEHEPMMLYSMGQDLCDLKRFDECLATFDRAVAAARSDERLLDEAAALQGKGHTLVDADRAAEAVAVLDTATTLARRAGYFDILASAMIGQARAARSLGRLPEALGHLEEAANTELAVRRRSGGSTAVQSGYMSEAGRTFDELIDVLYELHEHDPAAGYDRRAWRAAQRGRARSLLDLLDEAEVDLRLRADPAYRERETELRESLAALETRRDAEPDSSAALQARIDGLSGRLDTLEAELRRVDPRYAELRYPQPLALDRLQGGVLTPGEALLEYQLGAEHSHLWLITPDRFVMKRLPPRAEIEAAVRDLMPLLRDPTLTGDAVAWYLPLARRAAALLLDPIRDELDGVRRLVIAPDGVLHYLPFSALPVADSDAASFAEVPWLVRDLEVTTTPSASALARLRATPEVAGGSPLLLLADPELPGPEAGVLVRAAGVENLPAAPAAGREAAELSGIYGGAVRIWTGDRATVARLAERPPGGGWRTLQLATHGVFNEKRPRYSGLLLSPGEGDDGFLTVDEIFGLDLDCDQVVLSACSSALGEMVDGEGVIGLTRAFLYAGARSVVAALWDVSGDGAARFMHAYHARLAAAPDGSRTTALCAARRAFAEGGEGRIAGLTAAHPAFWAAFTAVGDAR